MLGLGALERNHLQPLETSVSRAIAHLYPVLHVHLLSEQHLGGGQERMLTKAGEVAELNLRKPGSSVTGEAKEDSALRRDETLGAVEGGVSLEDAQKLMMLQESIREENPSDLQESAKHLEINLHAECSSKMHRKGAQMMSESVSKLNDKVAGMVDVGTGAVVHSQQSERVSIQQPDTDRSISACLDISGPSGKATEMCSLIMTKPLETSDSLSSKEHISQECNASMSCSDQPGPPHCRRDGGGASNYRLCLHDHHFPLHPCAFQSLAERSSDSSRESIECNENDLNATCKVLFSPSITGCDGEVSASQSSTCRSITTDEIKKCSENHLQDTVPIKSCLSTEISEADNHVVEQLPPIKDQKNSDIPVIHPCKQLSADVSPIHNILENCIENIHPFDCSMSCSAVQLAEDFSSKIDVQIPLAHKKLSTGEILDETQSTEYICRHLVCSDEEECAKAFDTKECISESTNTSRTIDCHKNVSLEREIKHFSQDSANQIVPHTVAYKWASPCTEITCSQNQEKCNIALIVDNAASNTPDQEYKETGMTEEPCQTECVRANETYDKKEMSCTVDSDSIVQNVSVKTEQSPCSLQQKDGMSKVTQVDFCMTETREPCNGTPVLCSNAVMHCALSEDETCFVIDRKPVSNDTLVAEEICTEFKTENPNNLSLHPSNVTKLPNQQERAVLHCNAQNDKSETFNHNILKEVPWHVADRSETALEEHLSPTLPSLTDVVAPQFALVPYRGIAGFLADANLLVIQSTKENKVLVSRKELKPVKGDSQSDLERSSLEEKLSFTAEVLAGETIQKTSEERIHEGIKGCKLSHVGMEEHKIQSTPSFLSTHLLNASLCEQNYDPSTINCNLADCVAESSETSSCTDLALVISMGEMKPQGIQPVEEKNMQLPKLQHISALLTKVTDLYTSKTLATESGDMASENLCHEHTGHRSIDTDLAREQSLIHCSEPSEGYCGLTVKVISDQRLSPAPIVYVVKGENMNEKQTHIGDEFGGSKTSVSNHFDSLVTAGTCAMLDTDLTCSSGSLRSHEESAKSPKTISCSHIHSSLHEASPDPIQTKETVVLSENTFQIASSAKEDNSGISERSEKELLAEEYKQIKYKTACDKMPKELYPKRSLLPENNASEDFLSKSSNHNKEIRITKVPEIKEICSNFSKQRPDHQPLTMNTSQKAKRLKISYGQGDLYSLHHETTDVSLLNCIEMYPEKNMKLRPRPVKPPKETDDLLKSTFNKNSHSSKNTCMKRQPSRRCKSVLVQNVKAINQPITCKASIQKIPSGPIIKEYQFLLDKDWTTKLDPKASPRSIRPRLAQQRTVTPYVKHGSFQMCSKDQALLHHLSSIASRLMTPLKRSNELKSLSSLPEGTHSGRLQLHIHKLQEVFSCVNRRVNIQSELPSKEVIPAAGWAHPFSQNMNRYPVSPSRTCFLNLNEMFPLQPCNADTFPVSYHTKVDSRCLSDFLGLNPQLGMLKGPESTTKLSHPCKWTLSLLLSSHFPSENIHLLQQENLHFRDIEASSLSSNHRNSSMRRFSGCAKLGLHTVLALSSPGCYRLWTRKRNLGSRVPTVQRLSIAQFVQGVNRLPTQDLKTRELFFPFPYSLGRVLSTWSQHGPSTFHSDCTTSHASCCLWQSSQGSIIRSPNQLLHTPPLLLSINSPRWETPKLVDTNSSIAAIPKICEHHEDPVPLHNPSTPKAKLCPFEQREALPVSCARVQCSSQDTEKEELEKKPQRVSQIRIRKTVPKPDPNLTPMGLPKAKRLKKKEFSLEDIYTNKNYKSPPAARSLETIFEEPKEKNGILISTSQQKRKRVLEFRDFTVPRLKRPKGKMKVVTSCTRGRKAAMDGVQLDALLLEKLMELENFFLEEEAGERQAEAAVILS